MASLLLFRPDRPVLKPLDCASGNLSSRHLTTRSCRGGHEYTSDHRRWGTDKQTYGGVGGASGHVIRQGGKVSRSHRHYGTGITNCYAPNQPYRVTDLLLSDCRPYDQLLPPPLLTDEVIRHKQLCSYPTNHTYTSHRSKCAVFPLALPTQPPHRHTSLIQSTTDTLNQIHHNQFCTSTYNQTYIDHWKSEGELGPTTTTGRDTVTHEDEEETSWSQHCCLKCGRECCKCAGDSEPDLESNRTGRKGDTESASGCVETLSAQCEEPASKVITPCRHRNNSNSISRDCGLGVKTEVDSVGSTLEMATGTQSEEHTNCCLLKDPGDQSFVTNNAPDASDGGNGSTIAKTTKRVHWEDQAEDVAEKAGEAVKEEEKVGGLEREGEKVEREKAGEKERGSDRVVLAATSLPQLPDHFRRVSAKYCRNKLSPIWPCTIPFYLHHPHSLLHSAYITPTPSEMLTGNPEPMREGELSSMPSLTQDKNKAVEETEVSASSGGETAGREDWGGRDSSGGLSSLPPVIKTENQSGDVAGGNPSVLPLSAMLHVSGSRVPHRLGVRFRTQAHTRFHRLYPDKIPDLRESRVESKQYFFYQYHSSVFRGT